MQPYLGGVHSISLGHYYWKRPYQPYAALVNPRFHVCTSLAPRPMTVVFGLGTRLYVCACVQHLKMASYATDSSQAVL